MATLTQVRSAHYARRPTGDAARPDPAARTRRHRRRRRTDPTATDALAGCPVRAARRPARGRGPGVRVDESPASGRGVGVRLADAALAPAPRCPARGHLLPAVDRQHTRQGLRLPRTVLGRKGSDLTLLRRRAVRSGTARRHRRREAGEPGPGADAVAPDRGQRLFGGAAVPPDHVRPRSPQHRRAPTVRVRRLHVPRRARHDEPSHGALRAGSPDIADQTSPTRDA